MFRSILINIVLLALLFAAGIMYCFLAGYASSDKYVPQIRNVYVVLAISHFVINLALITRPIN